MSDSENTLSGSTINQEYPWHQSTWQKFIQARTKNHLPHAILLSGEEGIAKFPLAKRMAKSLLCMNTVSNATDACNQCQSCKTYESGANPDFTQITLLEDKQQIGVDQIRALSEFLNYSRSYNTNRVVILNPVERMNLNAANSLLKSLEEPSAHTVIILVTAKINQLLPTIKSRCQLFNVATPSKTDSVHWLQQQSQQNQESSVDVEAALEITGNKPLKAITISQEDLDSRNQFFHDLSSVISQNISITEMAKKWEKHDVETLLNWQILLIQKAIKHSLSTVKTTDNSSTSNNPLTKHLSAEDHWHLYQNLIKQKQYIHTSVNSLMFVENMIMLWLKAD
ncbi:MAG: DNA polymerase III subunit delta' [Cocleimonas sp.]